MGIALGEERWKCWWVYSCGGAVQGRCSGDGAFASLRSLGDLIMKDIGCVAY